MTGKYTHLKAVLLLVVLWGVSQTSWAQRSSAVEETEVEINGISRKGQRILIQLDSKIVEKAWATYLRDYSGGTVKGPSILPAALTKSQAGKGIYLVEKAKMDTISSNPMRLMSKVEGSDQGTMVWWTFDMGNAYLNKQQTPQEWERSKALLLQFAKQVYAQDVDVQIADAEKVLQNSQLESDRVIRQANEIQAKIAKNEQRKLELEAALVANAQELELLKKEVEANLKQQEAAKKEVDNMRKAVDLVKAKKASI